MDDSLADALPFAFDDPVAVVAAQLEWFEITRAVSASVADWAPELWLGRVLLEAQRASDRAVGSAQRCADGLIDDARAEAIAIREEGRRREQAIGRMRVEIRHSAKGAPADTVRLEIEPTPPCPRPRPSSHVGGDRLSTEPSTGRAPTVRFNPPPRLAAGPTPPPPLPPPHLRRERGTTSAAVQTPAVPGRPKRPVPRFGLRPTATAAAVIVAAALGLVFFERNATSFQEQDSQRRLTAQWTTAEAARPAGLRPAYGAALGLLSVPRLGIDRVAIVEGVSLGKLRRGPAHDATSQLPGQGGAVVVMGHRRTYGAPFARLGRLRTGDVISLRTPAGTFLYRVSHNPQVLAGSGSIDLPRWTGIATATKGGAGVRADQALVLATSENTSGTSIQVVVASLDQASTVSETIPAAASGAVHIRSVAGERIGMLYVFWWLAILFCGHQLSRRLRSKLPAALTFAASSVVLVLAVYQIYISVDRLLPGMY